MPAKSSSKTVSGEAEIFAARDAKLEDARRKRTAERNRAGAIEKCYIESAWAKRLSPPGDNVEITS